MAFQLNASDPLNGNIRALFMVDSDNIIKDLTGTHAVTADAAVTITSGTLGNSFLTTNSGSNALGLSVSPGVMLNAADTTVLMVTQSVVGSASRRSLFNAAFTNTVSPAILSSGNASFVVGSGNPTFDSGIDITTGVHSTATIRGESPDTFGMTVDGVSVLDGGKMGSDGTQAATYIGGNPSGGFGYLSANYTYIVVFNNKVSTSELLRLHNSLGANNTFALIEEAPATPISFSGPVANQEPSVNGEFRLDISSFFSGTETPFSFAVSPPISGVSIENNSEVVIAQPAAGSLPSNTTNIVIRGTDGNSNTADTNSFNVTWDLSEWGRKRSDIEAADETSGANPPFLAGDFDVGDLPGDRFRFNVTVPPTDGILTTTELSTGIFTGAADGVYFATAERFKNNVSYGAANISLSVVGGTVITVSLGTIDYSSNNTTVDLAGSVDLIATLGEINYTSNNALIQVSGETSINAKLGLIDYTSNDPVITLQGQASVFATLGSISYDSNNVRIQIGTGQLIGTVAAGFADDLYLSSFKSN